MSGGKPEVSEFDSVDPAPPSDDRNVATQSNDMQRRGEDVPEDACAVRIEKHWWEGFS